MALFTNQQALAKYLELHPELEGQRLDAKGTDGAFLILLYGETGELVKAVGRINPLAREETPIIQCGWDAGSLYVWVSRTTDVMGFHFDAKLEPDGYHIIGQNHRWLALVRTDGTFDLEPPQAEPEQPTEGQEPDQEPVSSSTVPSLSSNGESTEQF